MSLKTGDFGLNPEHPPLVKMLAAVPLLDMSLRVPALENREFEHEAFLGGKEFLFKNDADTMLFRARVAAAILTLLLAVLVFLAGQEIFGTAAGFRRVGSSDLRPQPNRARSVCYHRYRTDLLSVRDGLLLLPLCEAAALDSPTAAGWFGRWPGACDQAYGHPDLPHPPRARNLRMAVNAKSHTGTKRKEAAGFARAWRVPDRDYRNQSRCAVGLIRISLCGASGWIATESDIG